MRRVAMRTNIAPHRPSARGHRRLKTAKDGIRPRGDSRLAPQPKKFSPPIVIDPLVHRLPNDYITSALRQVRSLTLAVRSPAYNKVPVQKIRRPRLTLRLLLWLFYCIRGGVTREGPGPRFIRVRVSFGGGILGNRLVTLLLEHRGRLQDRSRRFRRFVNSKNSEMSTNTVNVQVRTLTPSSTRLRTNSSSFVNPVRQTGDILWVKITLIVSRYSQLCPLRPAAAPLGSLRPIRHHPCIVRHGGEKGASCPSRRFFIPNLNFKCVLLPQLQWSTTFTLPFDFIGEDVCLIAALYAMKGSKKRAKGTCSFSLAALLKSGRRGKRLRGGGVIFATAEPERPAGLDVELVLKLSRVSRGHSAPCAVVGLERARTAPSGRKEVRLLTSTPTTHIASEHTTNLTPRRSTQRCTGGAAGSALSAWRLEILRLRSEPL